MGAMPDYRGAQELLFKSQSYHVKDFSGIKTATRLTDRTYTSARATVKAPLHQLTARHGGHFKFELWVQIRACEGQKLLLLTMG
jgi:hypothetical protein